jgi:hypothetical protein
MASFTSSRWARNAALLFPPCEGVFRLIRSAIRAESLFAITRAVLLSPGFNGSLDAPKASPYCVSLYRNYSVNNKTYASHENYN